MTPALQTMREYPKITRILFLQTSGLVMLTSLARNSSYRIGQVAFMRKYRYGRSDCFLESPNALDDFVMTAVKEHETMHHHQMLSSRSIETVSAAGLFKRKQNLMLAHSP